MIKFVLITTLYAITGLVSVPINLIALIGDPGTNASVYMIFAGLFSPVVIITLVVAAILRIEPKAVLKYVIIFWLAYFCAYFITFVI